ncbi:hypothetical protein PIB30_041995 [Stylosanthes scabra]|uniref:RRM domain-containing protein n=1 Tax=Stylosanthes scabra TaxID=79078 RepID=A0ABU6QEI9_9FABA|nr:hypothetical protein [Stylosanthes scabra]
MENRVGVSRGYRAHERGIHCEGSGHAERRNKGESDGGVASGAVEGELGFLDVRELKKYELGCHTVFVDNIPPFVLKGEIFREFWRFGAITDVYVSRKRRKFRQGPFAFIRFREYGDALKAVKWMNGRRWRGKRIHVEMSRYRRNSDTDGGGGGRKRCGNMNLRNDKAVRGSRKIWKLTGRQIEWTCEVVCEEEKENVEAAVTSKKENASKKETQWEMLSRSLLGLSVEPINFLDVEERLLTAWDGLGRIQCRDVGPFRCLLTFESKAIRNEAVTNQVLMYIFDEVKHHWGPVWSLSRRVWVEVMGLSTFAWSEETFRRIALLWGKYVYADNRTEEMKSFTVARFLMDSFEWETIHEWVKAGGCRDDSASRSLVVETPMGLSNRPATEDGLDGCMGMTNVAVNVPPILRRVVWRLMACLMKAAII